MVLHLRTIRKIHCSSTIYNVYMTSNIVFRSDARALEEEEDEEEEEILGSDDDEQEDPKDYVKGR